MKPVNAQLPRGARLYLPDEAARKRHVESRLFVKATPSPALTAVEVPAGVDADRVVEGFATSHNITIDGGRGPTKGKIFRIGHMGYAAETDVIIALAALEQVLADLGQPVDFGAGVRAAQKVFVEKS